MKKNFGALLCSCITLFVCAYFFPVNQIGAQYSIFFNPPGLPSISFNQPLNILYQNNNPATTISLVNGYDLRIISPLWAQNSAEFLWDLIFSVPYMPEIQQFYGPSSQSQGIYQTAADGYFPYSPSYSFNQANLNYNPVQAPVFPSPPLNQTGQILSNGLQPFVFNSPGVNYNAQGSNFVSNPQWLLAGPSDPYVQRFNPYPPIIQGQPTLNYYGNNVPSGPVPYQTYIPNSRYYPSGTNGPFIGGIRIAAAPEAELVLANPDYGMYCWDPIRWLDGGYQVGIWCQNIPVRAQSLDKHGRLYDETPSFSVEPTGESGIMTILDSFISLYRGIIDAGAPADYLVTVVVDSALTVAVARRRSATCDSCHPTPPGHIGVPCTWGNCHECHDLGNVLHRHAYNACIEIDNCYRCHPAGCLSGVHGQLGMWCTPCHGTLEDANFGRMKISGQLGKPQCADCHDPVHSEPGSALFVDSAGHGGIWCINCHGATHVEVSQPVGLNNCTICHSVQANIPWMGSNCAGCHGSSSSPHLVTK